MTTLMFRPGDIVEVDPTPKNLEVLKVLNVITSIELGKLYRVEEVAVSNIYGGGQGVRLPGRGWFGATWFRLHKKGVLKQYFDV